MQQQFDIFIASLTSFWTKLAAFIPQLIAALVILFIGWIVAKLVRAAVGQILKATHFDQIASKSGIEAFLKQGNIDITLGRIISELVYWLVIMVVIVTVSNSLGLTIVAALFHKVVFYIPNIIIAILVLVFGTLLARFTNRVAFAYLNNMGVQGALTISTFSEYAIQIFVVFVSLEQLDIGTHLLTAAFEIAFGAISLALALAFGLGGKEWAARVIEKMTTKK